MKPQLLVLEFKDYSTKAIELYSRDYEVIHGLSDKKLADDRVQALVVRLAYRMDADILNRFTQLKFILSPTTGLTHIDTDYCQKRSIKVLSLKDMATELDRITSTAELTWGLLLSLVRNISGAHLAVSQTGEWNRDRFRSRQLSSLTLGILGMGRIGKQIARYAESFQMKTIFFDTKVESVDLPTTQLRRETSAESLFQGCDILSIHIPADPENFDFVNQKRLNLLKAGAYLINTSRGEVIDEAAVVRKISDRSLSGYATDVLKNESSNGVQNSVVRKAALEHSNILITPHIGGCTIDAMQATEEMIAERFMRGIR